MKKGDIIIDKRDNREHIVECVDVYDEGTLVFTEGKKYIPIEFVKEIDELELTKKNVAHALEIAINNSFENFMKDLKNYKFKSGNSNKK